MEISVRLDHFRHTETINFNDKMVQFSAEYKVDNPWQTRGSNSNLSIFKMPLCMLKCQHVDSIYKQKISIKNESLLTGLKLSVF